MKTLKGKLRVGIIETGRCSVRAHIPGLVRSNLCGVVCLCDVCKKMAEQKAKMFGIPEATTNAMEIIARNDLGIIDVCTREEHGETRKSLTVASLNTGKHVLVEKPVVQDFHRVKEAQSARVQEVINAAEKSHRERRWVDLPL